MSDEPIRELPDPLDDDGWLIVGYTRDGLISEDGVTWRGPEPTADRSRDRNDE